MKIDSKNIEFGYELISVIPYAYYHRDKLTSTRSGNDTESLYYFSPKHEINKAQRDYHNIKDVKYPNAWIHKPYLDLDEFEIPPYKEIYANDEFKFDKEIVVICNRHNIEWSYKAINYFSLDTLRAMFNLLQDKYQIVYINVDGRKELYDNAPPEPLGDFELLKEFPKVINFHDLVKNKSWNETQLKLFANCEKFITMNGGHAILSAYFGGENIVMSKFDKIYAKEIRPEVNSFYRFYHLFNKQRVTHVSNEFDLISRIKIQWVNDDPIVNILIRTSGRAEYFKQCYHSILMQSYKNVNIFVSDDGNADYTIPLKVYPIKVKKTKQENIPPLNGHDRNEYGKIFPPNLYFNEMHKFIKSGLIMYLDDDDMLTDNNIVENVVKEYKKGNDLIIWKVKVGKRVVPENENWKKIIPKHISGIGCAFDVSLISNWEPYRLGDYRVIKEMSSKAKSIKWINEIYSKTQNGLNFGIKLDKFEEMENIKIEFTKVKKGSKYKNGDIKELPTHLAKQYVITGQAVFKDEKKEKVVKKTSEKKPTKKPGRPKKSK